MTLTKPGADSFILIIFMVTMIPGITDSLLCNVAYRRPTSHSSAYYSTDMINGYSCNAVDGLQSQDFFDGSCFHSNALQNQWWEVNLGDSYAVEYIHIFARTDHIKFEHYKKMEGITITVDATTCIRYNETISETDALSPIKLTCDNEAHGRTVKIQREIKSLIFCEVEVYVNIPNITECPDPPSTWQCRDLCFEVNNSYACPTTTEATTAMTTETLGTTTCLCQCSSLGSSVLMNLTKGEILEKLKDVIDDMKINEDETTLAKNKLISIADNRPSAIAIGSMGILVLILVVGAIVLMDANFYIKVFRKLRRVYRNARKARLKHLSSNQNDFSSDK